VFGISTKLIGIGAIVLVLISVAGYIIHRERQDATEDALEGVRQNNERLANEAEQGALDYDDCKSAGRVWNYERNKCGGNAPGRRN
jgi:hypothetical protein